MSSDIGKLYPGMQSGTATLVAGSATVAFTKRFNKTPDVWVNKLAAQGTALTFVAAAGVSTTGFTVTSQELLSIAGGTELAFSGTVAVPTVSWLAYVDN